VGVADVHGCKQACLHRKDRACGFAGLLWVVIWCARLLKWVESVGLQDWITCKQTLVV